MDILIPLLQTGLNKVYMLVLLKKWDHDTFRGAGVYPDPESFLFKYYN